MALQTPFNPAASDPPPQVARAFNKIDVNAAVRGHDVQCEAYVRAQVVHGGALLATLGTQFAASLSNSAEQYAEVVPSGARRYHAIADAFTALVMEEIRGLGSDQ